MLEIKELKEGLLKLEVPEIIITGHIDGNMYGEVGRALAYLKVRNSPPVKIIIDSGGGDVDPGLNIYDLIRLYEGHTTGIVINHADSMASIILQACKKRLCARHAKILIHHISKRSVSLDILKDPEKLEELVKDMQKSQKRLYAIVGEKTKKSEEQIAEECKKDTSMTPEEAKAFGLIDEII